MKTKFFTLLLAVLANVASLDATIVDGIAYSLNRTDSTAQVIAGGTYSGHIVVPQYVTYRDISFCVTSIGEGAFANSAGLSSIALPNSIATIGNEAFKNCSNLDSCVLGKGLTDIGQEAFAGCNSLVALVIYAATPPVVESGNDIDKDWCTLYLPESYSVIYAATDWWKDFVTISYIVDDYDTDNRSNEKELLNVQIGGVDVTFDDTIGIARLDWDVDFSSLPVTFSLSPHATADFISGTTHDFSTPLYITVTSERGTQKRYTLKAKRTSENKCGDDVYYKVINDTLYIEGSGSMYDYSVSNSPFSSLMFSHVTIGEDVSSIGRYAFRDCTSLISITIPNSVTSIGNRTFSGCSGLTSVTIGNSVTSIESYAFEDCSVLTSVTIGNSVTSIESYAFYGCSGLTSVTIPNSVTSIGSGAFRDCILLQDINIPNSVTSLGGGGGTALYNTAIWNDSTNWENGVLYYDGWLIKAEQKNGFSFQSYEVPSFIRGIGGSALKECSCLISVTIPNSVTSIGDEAFRSCNGLTSVTIPNSVTSIGGSAFYGCSGLTSMTIPNSVTSIGQRAFYYCTGLTSVTIKAGTPPTLGSDAFYHTNNCPIYVPCGTLDAYKTAWSGYASQIKYAPAIDGITTYAANGHIDVTIYDNNTNVTICDGALFTLTATPDYGYHFSQWSDGNTDNPRTIVLASDTTFTAEFAKNTYTISTTSANLELGTTSGDTTALYLDEVEISAIPNYGYRFVRWDDNNTSNPRTVVVTEDKTYTATFAKDIFYITTNAEHGSISGNSSAEYLDFVTLTVNADYGYHFTQWSDGLKDNPRIFQITKDTTFTAEFAYDRVGTCGKDLALVWSYDPTNKVLTIGNAGSFTENMQFGVEAPGEMEELVIGNSVTAIGENAFAGISTLKKVTIGEAVKTIHNNAFYNCENLETIFNYRQTPTNAYSTAFDGVDKFACSLYVLPSSIDMYKNASVWRDFYYTYAIGAEEATVLNNDVKVEPQDNAATVTWPTSENAATYTIEITKDGVVFCTLIFNGNGQLTGIAFAPGKNGNRHAPAAKMTANGLQFTVTGLNSATHYALTLQAKDDQDAVLASYSSEFTTTGTATAIDNTPFPSGEGRGEASKILHNGQIFILRGEKIYTLTGQEVK